MGGRTLLAGLGVGGVLFLLLLTAGLIAYEGASIANGLALLVGDSAGSLAGGLARSLALTAAARSGAGLQSGPIQSLDMFHWLLSFS